MTAFDTLAEQVISKLSEATPLERQLYDRRGKLVSDAHLHAIVYGEIRRALASVSAAEKFKQWFDATIAIMATSDELALVATAYPTESQGARTKGALGRLQQLAADSMFALILRRLPKPPFAS